MYSGITYLGKNSYNDFSITMDDDDRTIGFPAKRKILVQVPFSNQEYDFSEVYGSQTYENRKLSYTFNVFDRNTRNKVRMNVIKTKLINWLMNSNGKQPLYDPFFPNYYFLAEVRSEADFQENWDTGTLSVTFEAYPFMVSELAEGNDIWDTFNFELDVAQVVNFDVDETLDITLYNVGTPDLIPKITTSSAMTIFKDGVTYNLSLGETKSESFVLKPGENDMTVNGTGSISFEFYKELI